jgi:hypothetical protein
MSTLRDPEDAHPMTDTGHDRPDDTVGSRRDTSLADDLLDRDDTSEAVRGGGERQDELRDVEPNEDEQDARRGDDDDYFEPHPQRRSRVTTGLLVALIFVLGMLCGVLAGRVLTPTRPPQIVYLLGDSTTSTPPFPSASAPPTSAPPASTPSAGG